MDENMDLNKNIDINQALKEFELKSSVKQIQRTPKDSTTPDVPKMVRLVMGLSGGVIKEQRQAEYVLFGFVIIAIIISLFLVLGALRSPSPPSSDKIIKIAGPQSEN